MGKSIESICQASRANQYLAVCVCLCVLRETFTEFSYISFPINEKMPKMPNAFLNSSSLYFYLRGHFIRSERAVDIISKTCPLNLEEIFSVLSCCEISQSLIFWPLALESPSLHVQIRGSTPDPPVIYLCEAQEWVFLRSPPHTAVWETLCPLEMVMGSLEIGLLGKTGLSEYSHGVCSTGVMTHIKNGSLCS